MENEKQGLTKKVCLLVYFLYSSSFLYLISDMRFVIEEKNFKNQNC